MAFSLEKLFIDVFAPQSGDIVTIMYDVPHGRIQDTHEWQERRQMAEEWQQEIAQFAARYNIQINPIVTYDATGVHNSDLPEHGRSQERPIRLEEIGRNTTILISMPQFSATAPLIGFTRKFANLRVASLPTVAKAMQETSLAADYNKIAQVCAQLAPLFNRADGVEVLFSTGDTCYFDIAGHTAEQDNGQLPPGSLRPGTDNNHFRLINLPSGEVFILPNESPDSKTNGRIPVQYGSETTIFVVQHNQIVDVIGNGRMAAKMRQTFNDEKALRNVAEVAIGCNDKAAVTGNVLEDEKAGFHWAYGRSDQFGGTIGPKDFSAPNKVAHQDIVYAKGSPIVCQRLDFIFPDGTKQTVIRDGVLDL
ncbi:MAG: hypothetical protein WAM60_15565 [Candidatus Promineifilaceae bacterium]